MERKTEWKNYQKFFKKIDTKFAWKSLKFLDKIFIPIFEPKIELNFCFFYEDSLWKNEIGDNKRKSVEG